LPRKAFWMRDVLPCSGRKWLFTAFQMRHNEVYLDDALEERNS
jgi:hypothetical protein